MLNLLTAVIAPVLDNIIDLIPNENDKRKAEATIKKLTLEGLNKAIQGQIETNLQEAKHKSVFVAGWRPFIGWVCGVAIAWSFLVIPIIQVIGGIMGVEKTDIPIVNTDMLYQLVLAMLGMGTLRTFEKTKK